MATFLDTQSPATPAEIAALERYAGLVFPIEYRSHLLRYNGGRCESDTFDFVEDGKTTSSRLDWFLATHEQDWGDLKDYIECYKMEDKRLPSNMLPIAYDPGGNLICLSCAGPDLGAIYFWNHEQEVDYLIAEDNDYSNLYLVAGSFNQFLVGLKPFEETAA